MNLRFVSSMAHLGRTGLPSPSADGAPIVIG
jgi:hypothetical protein